MSRTALIVDDDYLTRRLLEAALTSHGLECVQATNGAEAIEQIAAQRALDIIVLDLFMPVLDGFAVIDWIRSHRSDLLHKLVVITAGKEKIEQVRALGVPHVTPKPFDLHILLSYIIDRESSERT